MNGRRPQVPSIYTRDSSVSSQRPSTSVSSISTVPPSQPIQVPSRAPPPAPVAVPQNGVLLLVVAGTPNAGLKSYVETALLKGISITEVLVLGEKKQEQTLKQLKVDMYGLAGKMQRELGVQVEFMSGTLTEEELSGHLGNVLERRDQRSPNGVNGNGVQRKELHGVLCDLDEDESQPADILELETTALMDQWTRSVGFVHVIARCTMPMLRVAVHKAAKTVPPSEKALRLPFFATTLPSAATNNSSMHDTALRALLDNLSTLGNRDITFGSAEVLLAPEPEPINRENAPALAPTNGWNDQADDFSAGESPTKLWGMWSMQQELGDF